MPNYKLGDVVIVPFAYEQEGNLIVKKRPGVILKKGPTLIFAIIQVTSKNRTDGSRGIWVKQNSSRGINMGLRFDSFINLGVIRDFHESEILALIGKVDEDCFDELEMIYEELKSSRKG